MTSVQEEFVSMEIEQLLQIGTITRRAEKPWVVSPIGVVPKKNGKSRLIIDMRWLNKHLHVPKFRMEDLKLVSSLVQVGDHLTTIDLQDGYHHITI